jgi:CelD/BcsL family acetyltransferase involved in cellulose biosynthesis
MLPSVAHAAQPPFVARIDVLDDLAAAEPVWHDLETRAVATAFQRFGWASAWQHHVGAPAGLRPLIVVGRDRTGTPVFLLPFVRSGGLLAIARFPGGNHVGCNMGLWCREAADAATAEQLQRLLCEVARTHGIDLFVLTRQPPRWRGLDNPFVRLPRQDAVDDASGATFPPGSGEEALKSILTRDMRNRLRSKERKLERLAGYRYFRPADQAGVDRVLDAFFVQKAAHFAAQGIRDVFADPAVAAFLRDECLFGLDAGQPNIELHALECDSEVIAVMGGAADKHHFSCMFNSYTVGESGRWSPGLVLITHIARDCAERGRDGFDLGPGAALYKNFFCREPIGLFDTFLPMTWRGRLAGPVLAATAAAKRRVKANSRVMGLVQRLRRSRAG